MRTMPMLTNRCKSNFRDGVPDLQSALCPLPSACYLLPAARRGLTLVEMLISIAITGMIAVTLGGLARGVQLGSQYCDGRSTATQHARVALERIGRFAREATANENFPGIVGFSSSVGSVSYPETIVIWHPSSSPANPTGLPLFREIVVYAPNAQRPSELLEITAPNDSRQVPAITNTSAWASELANLQTSGTKTMLTDILRAPLASTGDAASARGAVRFIVERHPTASEWARYRAGTLAFEDVNWVQGMYGTQTGLSQTWLRTELQLIPPGDVAQTPVPFFGSAAVYFELNR